MNFWLCFTCPSRFCELLPGDLESSAIFVEDLISQALKSLTLIAIVSTVKLDFLIRESIYFIRIHIWYYVRSKEVPNDLEATMLEIESLASQALLQCFWEVRCAEC